MQEQRENRSQENVVSSQEYVAKIESDHPLILWPSYQQESGLQNNSVIYGGFSYGGFACANAISIVVPVTSNITSAIRVTVSSGAISVCMILLPERYDTCVESSLS
jgi:hypothetical protein